jgi:signal transduction histidine kinase
MIVYWSYTFRRRLALLQAAAVRIGRGDFSIPVATKGSDELSALGDSFNGMMTQLSAAQDALVQSKAKIEMKNREILDLTNVVVHDLKKPLTVMKTVCSLFKIGSCGTLNDEGKEAMAIGSQTLSYMEEMLGDLLENARLEAGANTLEFEEFDLNGLITDVLSRLRYIAEEKGVQITIQPGIGIVKADKKSVAKVYMNLIGNALNYLSPGPDKKIAVGTADVDGQKAFFVRDNGIGIPVDTQKTLFQKFKRGSNVGEISGTGLGLSIVRGIVGAHGGKVWAESRVNEGTTFYFTLSRR